MGEVTAPAASPPPAASPVPAESPVPRVGVPSHLARDMTTAEQTDWLAGFLRRHRVSRRAALQGAVTGAAALAVVSSPWGRLAGRAFAAPNVMVIGRRLSFGNDPTTQMVLGGELTGALPSSATLLADIGLTTDYGRTVAVEVRQLITQLPQSAGTTIIGSQQFFAHAPVAGLTAGTTYHWRFRWVDATGEAATADSTFSTAPARGGVAAPFTFTALGDHGINEPAADATGRARGAAFTDQPYDSGDTRRAPKPASSLVSLIAAEPANAFHLLCGDICYADQFGLGEPAVTTSPTTTPQTYQNFNPFAWTTYFQTIQASAARVPWMFGTGNHDMEAIYGTPQSGPPLSQNNHGYGGHLARLDLPTNGPSVCPSVYSFTYGNVAVLSLDANDFSKEIPSNLGYSGGAQLSWLRARLAGFRADPTVDFIVAFFHHCAYSTSATHASDGGVRDALAPLFQQFAVDLVVQGHNHQYERTNPIKNNRSTKQAPDLSTVYPAVDGTTYVLIGSGGRPRYPFQPGSKERFRGDGVPDSDPGAGPTVTNSYVWTGQGAPASAPVRQDGITTTAESVDWSQARYDNYAYLAVDVTPAPAGQTTTLVLRAITDLGAEIDRLTLSRTAGAGTLAAVVPEVPQSLLLPAAGLAIAGGVLAARHASSATHPPVIMQR